MASKVIRLSGDKSISHRALMLSSISKGSTRITNLCSSKMFNQLLTVCVCVGQRSKKVGMPIPLHPALFQILKSLLIVVTQGQQFGY